MAWLETAGGYQVTLQAGEVVCRNPAGRALKSVPPAIREDPVVVGLRQLTEWLARHEGLCRSEVERWMVRSLPVPMPVLQSVWPDDAWRAALSDLVVEVPGDGGAPAVVGLLRAVDERGVGVVELDGDTHRLPAAQVLVPHPILLPQLDEWREFAADLELRQTVDQLFRAIWSRPPDLKPQATSCGDFSGGEFPELRRLKNRAATMGYPVRGGYAVCRVFEAGRTVEARYWIGADDPYWETTTGDLVFTVRNGAGIKLVDVGPVAWSEGMRMAAALYAGRTVSEAEDRA